MNSFTTKGGEMLDEICFAHYGNDDQSDKVLKANKGLEKQPFILPPGVSIVLPEVTSERKKAVTLW